MVTKFNTQRYKKYTPTPSQSGEILLHGAAFIDSSGNGNSVTPAGDSSANSGGPLGAGYYDFDGTGDYINIGNWSLDSDVISISGFASVTSGFAGIFGNRISDPAIALYVQTDMKVRLNIEGNDYAESTASVTYGVDFFFQVLLNGTSAKVYIDGVLVIDATETRTTKAADLVIGADSSNATNTLTGTISEFLITYKSDVLSVPSSPYSDGKTTLLLHGNNLLDYSGNGAVATLNGTATYNKSDTPFNFGGCFGFDGGTTTSINTGVAGTLGSGAFHFDIWIKPGATAASNSAGNILGTTSGSAAGAGTFYLTQAGNFYATTNGGSWTDSVAPYASPTIGSWSHFAVSRSDDGSLRVYLNGVLIITGTSTVNITSTTDIYLGTHPSYTSSGYRFDGDLTEPRVCIGNDGGWTGSTIEVPTAPYGFDPEETKPTYTPTPAAYTVGLWHGNNLLDYSGNGHELIAEGNASSGNSGNPFGFGGVYLLDGAGDAFTVGTSTDFDLGTNNFVFDCWINIDSLATTRNIFTMNLSGLALFEVLTDGSLNFFFVSSFINTGAAKIAINTDYHIALVRIGSDWSININGISEATASNSADLGSSSGDFILFRNHLNSSYFSGSCSEIRLLNGSSGSLISVPTSPYGLGLFNSDYYGTLEAWDNTDDWTYTLDEAGITATPDGSTLTFYSNSTGHTSKILDRNYNLPMGNFEIQSTISIDSTASGTRLIKFGIDGGGIFYFLWRSGNGDSSLGLHYYSDGVDQGQIEEMDVLGSDIDVKIKSFGGVISGYWKLPTENDREWHLAGSETRPAGDYYAEVNAYIYESGTSLWISQITSDFIDN